MAAITRKQYKGAAAQTTITSGINGSATTVQIASNTGWATGAEPFYVVISPGSASEEKCLATISGTTLTLTRAQDDTTAQTHASGATIYPVFSADEADEANFVASRWTTKGDLVTFDGTDVARQGVGTNDHVLTAASAETNGMKWGQVQTAGIADSAVTSAKIAANTITADDVSVDLPLGYRNVVINGAMQIAQRGTSTASITTSGYYTADRFKADISSFGTFTQSVENDAPTGSGLRKSLKMLCTTADATPAAGDTLILSHNLEGQNLQQFLKGTASAKGFTLTFWVKGSTTGTYIVNLYDYDNTRSVSASYSIAVADTWEKKTLNIPADTTGAFDNDNAMSMSVFFWLGAGSTYTSGTLNTTWASATNANRAVGQTNVAGATNRYWQITGVQLEAGSVATPFGFEDYGTTLAKCQRYFFRKGNDSTYEMIGSGLTGQSNFGYVLCDLPTTMRSAPTLAVTAANTFAYDDGTNTGNPATVGADILSPNTCAISFSVAGLTASRGARIYRDNVDTCSVDFSAEL